MTSLRSVARAVRHGPDRLAHAGRRRRAVDRVRRASPAHLLVVCLGNICRSPYAERRLRELLDGREVRSAGLLEAGRSSPRTAVEVALDRGVALDDHRSVRLSPEWIAWADLVLVMNGSQENEVRSRCRALGTAPLVEWLGDFDPGAIARRALRDPYDRERDVFEAVYARIDACCRGIAEALSEAP